MKFETGKIYTSRSAVDSDTTYGWKVVSRTEKTMMISEVFGSIEMKAKRVKIQPAYDESGEWAYPDGRYSMCPVIRANRHL